MNFVLINIKKRFVQNVEMKKQKIQKVVGNIYAGIVGKIASGVNSGFEEIKDQEDYPEINKNNKKYGSSTDVIKDRIKNAVNMVIDKAVDAVAEEQRNEKKDKDDKTVKPQVK